MSLSIHPLSIPLRIDETGTVRVGDTRVTLDLVVARFEEGAAPEEIVHSYDTLRLPDVYAVLAYYLTHKEEVDEYLRQREAEALVIRQKLEAEGISQPAFWAELKKRAAQSSKHAAPAQ